MGRGEDANFVIMEATGQGDSLYRTQKELPFSRTEFTLTGDPILIGGQGALIAMTSVFIQKEMGRRHTDEKVRRPQGQRLK